MFWRSSKETIEEDEYVDEVEARNNIDLPPTSSYGDTYDPPEPHFQSVPPTNHYDMSTAYAAHDYEPVKPNQQTAESKVSKDDVLLILGKLVYLSGPYRNRDTTKATPTIRLHIIKGDGRFYPVDFERWKPFRYKEQKASRTKFTGSESGIVVLQDTIDITKHITVSWSEFAENFLPFNADDSGKVQNFATNDWNAAGANMIPDHHRSSSVDGKHSRDFDRRRDHSSSRR